MKTIFISILILTNISFAQRLVKTSNSVNISPETDIKEFSSSSENTSSKYTSKKDFKYRLESLEFNNRIPESRSDKSLDLFGKFGNNVSFGGFYESYAIINFTPRINIKPAEFLSIYADHYLNVLIPVSRAKDVSKSILINSISMLALDNATSLLFSNDNWLAEIAEFALKNCMINLFLKPALDNTSSGSENILRFDNFYYSVSISF